MAIIYMVSSMTYIIESYFTMETCTNETTFNHYLGNANYDSQNTSVHMIAFDHYTMPIK